MHHHKLGAILLLLAGACQSNPKNDPMPVHFTITNAPDYQVHLVITNLSTSDKLVNTFSWQIPSLVLEIVDSSGNRIPPLPPPVPDEGVMAAAVKALKPGDSLSLDFNGLGVSLDQLYHKIYRIRCKGYLQNPVDKTFEPVHSEWQEITLTRQ